MSITAAEIIEKLGMQLNNEEGGYFASTYPLSGAENPPCSAIYYLLDNTQCSVLHKVTGDMLYHFYLGAPVEMLLLYPEGHTPKSEVCVFSNDILAGNHPMKVIPGGTWLGSRVITGGDYALMGVTMAPAFNPADYFIGDRHALIAQYPEQKDLIIQLTPDPKG